MTGDPAPSGVGRQESGPGAQLFVPKDAKAGVQRWRRRRRRVVSGVGRGGGRWVAVQRWMAMKDGKHRSRQGHRLCDLTPLVFLELPHACSNCRTVPSPQPHPPLQHPIPGRSVVLAFFWWFFFFIIRTPFFPLPSWRCVDLQQATDGKSTQRRHPDWRDRRGRRPLAVPRVRGIQSLDPMAGEVRN